MATGYNGLANQPALPGLDRLLHAGLGRLIEGYDAIADVRGRPHRFGEETAIPGLFFVGFGNPATGALREIAIEALQVAAAIGSANTQHGG